MSRLTHALATVASALCVLLLAQASPASAGLAPSDTVASSPDDDWGWERHFEDSFDGPAGTWPDQWHVMPGWNAAAVNGTGQLDVGHLAQLRSTPGWTLPAGTQVRVTASLVMPDTGSNYAALWVQHPDPVDPREVDVIESYGPLKTAGAQLGSHLCYDATDDLAGDPVGPCDLAGLGSELRPVGELFAEGVKPWQAQWQYAAEFTVGGDSLRFTAADGDGNLAYDLTLPPDARRVPGNALPFHLRLSNKDVLPEHVVAGGTRASMLVDWVTVDVKYP